MKNFRNVMCAAFSVLVLTAMIISLGSCDLSGLAIDARISSFISDLNSADRISVYTNFHPLTGDREAIKDPVFFESGALAYAYAPFAFYKESGPTENGSGQMEVIGTMTSEGGLPAEAYFLMEQDGGNWLIRIFTFSGVDIRNAGSVPVSIHIE